MPTFLRFRRPVKPLAESLGVCALTLFASCVRPRLERISEAPPTRPERPAHALALLTLTPGAQADAGTASPTSLPNVVDSASVVPNATGELSIEEPYTVDARPRSTDSLQAAADDEQLARWDLGGTSDPSYPSSQASYHPGTRVVVDVYFASRRGSTSNGASRNARLASERLRAQVQAQARSKGYWPFRLCFEAGQRQKVGLGGETRIAFTINLRGNVSAAQVVSSRLGNLASTTCLLNELRKLRFAPRPLRRLDMRASIRIWPGDAELPPLTDGPPATVETSNGFDPTTVRARALSKQGAFLACFGEARRTDLNLWGRLAFAVTLEVDGTVHRVTEVESHFPSASAARCAATALASIVFPSVSGRPFRFVLAMRLPPSPAAPPLHTKPDRPEPGLAPNSPDSGAAGADD